MKLILTTIAFTTALSCFAQIVHEQIALDFFESEIGPQFSQYQERELTFYFNGKSTDSRSELDFSRTRRPFNQSYEVDIDKLEVDKCDKVDRHTLKQIKLIRPGHFKYKSRYVNRQLHVYIWKLKLWRRNERGELNVYVDRVNKCGQTYVVNITLRQKIDSIWYNFLICMNDSGEVFEWWYTNYIA